jgi:hypothetical protein
VQNNFIKIKLIIMKHIFLSSIILTLVLGFASCKQDSPAPPAPVSYSFKESFDSLSVAYAKGWESINRSAPLGIASWTAGAQGSYTTGTGKSAVTTNFFLSPQASTYSGQDCIFASTNSGAANSDISNWMFTPSIMMKNGDKISFFTRTVANPAAKADRLQVRLNPVDDNTALNYTATATGSYSSLLLDINPNLVLSGTGSYPATWTKYTITLSGLTGLAKHRVAFRYFVPNSGGSGTNGIGIALDEFEFTSAL